MADQQTEDETAHCGLPSNGPAGRNQALKAEQVAPLKSSEIAADSDTGLEADRSRAEGGRLADGTPLALKGACPQPEDETLVPSSVHDEIDCVEVARLKYLSEHDELTGQKNRHKLHEALEEKIDEARQQNVFCSFVIAAIDNLSVINDNFGYQLGDEVIAAVALQLAEQLRKHDIVGRYSTSKFGLILPRCGPDALHATLPRLLSRLANEPVKTSKGIIPVTLSMGGVVTPQFAGNAQEAVSRSLEALDSTKRKSSNNYVVYEYSSEREKTRTRNLEIAEDMINALNEGRMHLSLQPIVAAECHSVMHYECLLVMETKGGEMIGASEFLPVAEKLGLCRLIDYHTLDLAAALLKEDPALKLTLNVSTHTTGDPNWLIVLRAKAGRRRDVLERLMVEITETVSIRDVEATASFVAALRDLGCSVAIDDFGAGYTSYRNLRKLDVDVVKIDGEFVKEIAHSIDDQIFVSSLVELARSFDMKTVAEWVDDKETADFLRDAGVDYLQGFLFGRPEICKAGADEAAEGEAAPLAQMPAERLLK